ncbi:hypothetical protein MC885_017640 [Smutsia gigantea]|nr:hypothetical protein MC885_017640 [Smutsia gigantea]
MPGRRLPGRFNGGQSSSVYLSTPSSASKPNMAALVTPLEIKTKVETDDGKKNSLDELRAQVAELLCIVEALKKDHGRELEKLRKDLEEEKAMRSNLEMGDWIYYKLYPPSSVGYSLLLDSHLISL